MIGIKIRGGFLVTNSSTAISFELVSTIFLGDGESFTPGSYSFPFDLPLEENRITLGLPEVIGNAEPLLSKEPCEVYFDNIRLPLEGLASISEVSGGVIKFYITIQALEPLKKTKLNELDLGGSRDFGPSVPNRLAVAKDSGENPLDHDFAFFPVLNFGFWNSDNWPGVLSSSVQNLYNDGTGEFVSSSDSLNAMPFVRIDYLLRKCFEHFGLEFTNSFQDNDDLKKLYLYNNYSIYVNNEWGRHINLVNHVPPVELTTFLRFVQRYFCLAILKEPFDNNYELVVCNELLQQAPAHDWTDKLLSGTSVNQSPLKLKELRQKANGQDGMEKILVEEPPAVVGTVDNFEQADAQPNGPGYYYVRGLNAYVYRPSARLNFIHPWNNKEIGTDGEVLEFDLGVPPTEYYFLYDLPRVMIPGTLPDDDPDKDYRNEYPLLLLQYLGIYPLITAPVNSVPVASATGRANDGSAVSAYATTLDGDNGVYKKFWANWANMLYNGREVTARLTLTLPDILNFRFKHIVRIQNMNYFVKSLRVNFTQKGLEPVEAKLVSIV